MRKRAKWRLALLAVFLPVIATVTVAFALHKPVYYIPSSFSPIPATADLQKYRELIRRSSARHNPLHFLFQFTSTSIEVADALHLEPTDVVADIGCGTGGFEVFLLEEHEQFAKLYAVDIDGSALDFLRFMLQESQLADREKIETIHSTTDDVSLSPDSIDVLFLLNTPFYLPGPNDAADREIDRSSWRCLTSIAGALKEGGRLHVFHEKMRKDNRDIPGLVSAVFAKLGLRCESSQLLSLKHHPLLSIDRPLYHLAFVK